MPKDEIKEIIDKDAEQNRPRYKERVMKQGRQSKNVEHVDWMNKNLRRQPVYKKGKDYEAMKEAYTSDIMEGRAEFDMVKRNVDKKPIRNEKVTIVKYPVNSGKESRFKNDLNKSAKKYLDSMDKLDKKRKK